VLARHPSRADDAGPQALARRPAFLRERSTLGAPPRDLCLRPRAGCSRWASSPASLSRPLLVAEGGFPEPPGCLLAWTSARDAASRSAFAMPRDSTLGERDDKEHRQGKRNEKRNRPVVPPMNEMRWTTVDSLNGTNVGILRLLAEEGCHDLAKMGGRSSRWCCRLSPACSDSPTCRRRAPKRRRYSSTSSSRCSWCFWCSA
jgi:hypothetical protein